MPGDCKRVIIETGGQARDIRREVAFMGTADKEVAGAERTDDLRCARDERNHAFGLNIGHIACTLSPATDRNQKSVDLISLRPGPRVVLTAMYLISMLAGPTDLG
jgi:hypothetical protein